MNRSSPVCSVNRKPVLSDARGRERASSSACAVDEASDISISPAVINLAGSIRRNDIASVPDDAFVQPGNGVERRQDRAFLPRRNVGGVLARQNDPAVDLAQIVVMLLSRFLTPGS